MITNKMKRRIKQGIGAEKPTVWIGKEGSTAQIANEITRQLDQHEVVKARILQAALKDTEAKEMATTVAAQAGASLIEVRGHTFILYKSKKKRKETKIASKLVPPEP
jgi:RNA-binding protein